MSSLFDPASLLNSDLGENSTRREPLPVGEPIAQITKVDIKSGESPKGKWTRLDVSLDISDADYMATYLDGTQDKAMTTFGIMLDIDQNTGNIAVGPNKNVRLGRFREACGVNGKPLSALVGQFVRVAIQHKPAYNDPSQIADEITGFSKV
jgi:hypothetical protein